MKSSKRRKVFENNQDSSLNRIIICCYHEWDCGSTFKSLIKCLQSKKTVPGSPQITEKMTVPSSRKRGAKPYRETASCLHYPGVDFACRLCQASGGHQLGQRCLHLLYSTHVNPAANEERQK